MSALPAKSIISQNVWPIFISYRRSNSTRHIALWLKQKLEEQPVESNTGQIFRLDVFVDAAEAHQSDFQANLVPHLRHSRALIVIADKNAGRRNVGPENKIDYLYDELDWWAAERHR